MPIYKFKCPKCQTVYRIAASFAEYAEVKHSKCKNPECGEELVRVFAGESPQVFLPAEGGFSRKGFI